MANGDKRPLQNHERLREVSDRIRDMVNTAYQNGAVMKNMLEAVPKFNHAECEEVISNSNNSWIVLGRDRPASKTSGYGGKGATGCGSIDLVCGRQGWDPDPENFVDPNFKGDAARVYISQMADIDHYFDLCDGSQGVSRARSAVGMQADAVRIVGREGVKIVTKPAKKNSHGADIERVNGIELIAGNDDDDVQPMIKGDNLVQALESLSEYVADLAGITGNFIKMQMRFNSAVGRHTHPPPIPIPVPHTPVSLGLAASSIGNAVMMLGRPWNDCTKIQRKLIGDYQSTYLKAPSAKRNLLKPGIKGRYICSMRNRTN
jgi:hypothetical protein